MSARFRCVTCDHRFVSDSIPTGPEGCPECAGLSFGEVSPPAPLPCPAGCDEGQGIRGVGEAFTCAACRGSGKARCTVCREGDAVRDDEEELVCSGCLAEMRADAARDRAVAAMGDAIVLLALACARQMLLERAAVAALRAQLGLDTWRPTPVDARIAYCALEDTGRCDCAMCTGAKPRHCTPPPPPAITPPLPPMARVDPDSRTWRAMRATVRPGQVSP